MNAVLTPTHLSKAITAQVLNRASPFDFARQLRADAVRIRARVEAGELVVFHGALATPEDIAGAVRIDGGIVWPSSTEVSL